MLGVSSPAMRRALVVAWCTAALVPYVCSGPRLHLLRLAEGHRAARSAFYERLRLSFVGGYTVAGTAFSQGGANGSTTVAAFTVPQECLCEAESTADGIFVKGANENNAFSLIASASADGHWRAHQVSVGLTPGYRATMDFGATAGGAHTAVGSFLGPAADGSQTTFRAEQSKVGCHEGVGAATCARVCATHRLSWAQIQRKCATPTIEHSGLDGQTLTDFAEVHADGSHRTSAAIFTQVGSELSVYGSDDGVTFWTLAGRWVAEAHAGSRELEVDFAPKGGPHNLRGVWDGERIWWRDGNKWTHDAPPCVTTTLREMRYPTSQETKLLDAIDKRRNANCWRAFILADGRMP